LPESHLNTSNLLDHFVDYVVEKYEKVLNKQKEVTTSLAHGEQVGFVPSFPVVKNQCNMDLFGLSLAVDILHGVACQIVLVDFCGDGWLETVFEVIPNSAQYYS
jgi:hypothetical protein